MGVVILCCRTTSALTEHKNRTCPPKSYGGEDDGEAGSNTFWVRSRMPKKMPTGAKMTAPMNPHVMNERSSFSPLVSSRRP